MTAAVVTCPLDASHIAPKLYQGSMPIGGWAVRQCGFDVLVLAAREWQPPDVYYPGVEVIRARIDDSGRPMTRDEWNQAVRAGQQVAYRLQQGKRVLTTCAQGRNRSGMVNTIALYLVTGIKGADLVKLVRNRRPKSLENEYFVNALRALQGS